MAYTTAQLVSAYTNANLGKVPDAATTLTLDAYATQSQTGGISDTVALANTLKLVNNTTAVAIETYQFFTNRAPSVAGLTYLVNSATNTADLNDAYYAKFGQENRFINFAINLATGSGEGAAAFALAYGNTSTSTVTYEQTVATAYDKIIGNAVAAAAGVDVAATVKFFSRADNITYLTNFVKANTGLTAAADIDLAVKAALIGEILNAATVNNIGGYAAATAAMLADLSDGVLSTDTANGVNIITSYQGTGTVGTTFNLTASIDTLTGTNANDTFNGIATATAGSATVNLLDSIDGGAGNDTLNLSNAGASTDLDVSVLSVKNVETVNFTSVTGLAAGAADFSSWTGLQAANVSLAAPTAAQAVTVAGTTNANLTVAKVGANNVSLQGGKDVVVSTTGGTGSTLSIGTTTAVAGNLTATAAGAYADGANTNQGAISTKGGVNVIVTQATGVTAAQSTAAVSDATNFTVNQGAITVTGTSATKSVSVSQAAATAAVAATQESVTVTGVGLAIGQSVTLAGLTFTATSVLTGAQVAAVFGGLADGATTGAGGAGLGTYSGALTGYSTGAAAGTAVLFSATTLGNAANVVSSDTTAASVGTITQGTNGAIGVTAGAVTITDVNAASATTAGTIGTISLTNSTAAITANAVTTLTLADSTANLTANTGNALVSKALALTVSGTSALNDVNNEIATINVSNSAAASLSIADTGLSALNVSGSKQLTLTGAGALTGLKTVTVTGAGGLSADLSGLGAALTKVDTTGSTGASAIKIAAGGAGATAFAGGAGADTVTLVGATPAGSSISLGAGDDRLLGTTAVAVSTTSVIDGGAGNDAVASTLINAGNAGQFKNFEVLNLAETGGIFDVSLLTGSTITTLELNGGTGGGTYANVGLGQGVSVTGTGSGTTTLSFGTAAAGTTDAYSITFAGTSTGTAASPATVAAGTVSVEGIENVKIASGAAAGVHTNTITLSDTSAQTLAVTGSNAITLAFGGAGFGTAGTTGLSSIDASAVTGVVTVNLANTGLIGTGLTLKTGSGADVITVGNIGATGAVTITTGGGKDTVDVSGTLGVIGSGATTASHVTITDLSAGDKITFVNHGVETFTSAKVDVSTANDFADALGQAAAGNGSVNSIITWFQYGGNTYIVENNTAAGFDATDVVVKLTGTVDLSTALLSNPASGSTGPSLTLV